MGLVEATQYFPFLLGFWTGFWLTHAYIHGDPYSFFEFDLRDFTAFAAGIAGLLELTSIYYAVFELGKSAIMPFIAIATTWGSLGYVIVGVLRLILVGLAWLYKLDYLNLALLVWWLLWLPLNVYL